MQNLTYADILNDCYCAGDMFQHVESKSRQAMDVLLKLMDWYYVLSCVTCDEYLDLTPIPKLTQEKIDYRLRLQDTHKQQEFKALIRRFKSYLSDM